MTCYENWYYNELTWFGRLRIRIMSYVAALKQDVGIYYRSEGFFVSGGKCRIRIIKRGDGKKHLYLARFGFISAEDYTKIMNHAGMRRENFKTFKDYYKEKQEWVACVTNTTELDYTVETEEETRQTGYPDYVRFTTTLGANDVYEWTWFEIRIKYIVLRYIERIGDWVLGNKRQRL